MTRYSRMGKIQGLHYSKYFLDMSSINNHAGDLLKPQILGLVELSYLDLNLLNIHV